MQQVARPGPGPLEYAEAPPLHRSWRFPAAVGVCHLLASIVITWQWQQQGHAHMLHRFPFNPFEQAVQVVMPVLLFPLVDLWIWCVRRLPDLNPSVKVPVVIVVFLANSMVWALMASLVLKLVRRRPAA
jgi:hypothetical protein